MGSKVYSFKKIFRLHIRIGFLVTLVAFILGFIFTPEVELGTYQPKVERIIEIDRMLEPVEVVKIPPPERVKLPVEAEDDEDATDEPLPVTIFTDDGKTAGIDFEFPKGFTPFDIPPKPLNLGEVKFNYPKHVIMLGIEGTVYLELCIDTEGNVRNVEVIKSVYPALDKVASENAWKLKFSPAIQWDKPVAVRYSFPVRFRLE